MNAPACNAFGLVSIVAVHVQSRRSQSRGEVTLWGEGPRQGPSTSRVDRGVPAQAAFPPASGSSSSARASKSSALATSSSTRSSTSLETACFSSSTPATRQRFRFDSDRKVFHFDVFFYIYGHRPRFHLRTSSLLFSL